MRVVNDPEMITKLTTFDGLDDEMVVREDWDEYEDLRGFEEKLFGFGAENVAE
jgi:alpha 1,2-mannosyltransferase